jgi:aromatic ring-opening dioxygenase LigB subunit
VPRRLHSVGQDEPPAGCRQLGKEIGGTAARTGLLVMGDGSARRGPRAPGHYDERAAAFDAEVERAVRAGDLQALMAVDPALARELMATGRPAWQVLAGATAGTAPRAEVMYAGDPLGVMYLVAFFQM